MEQTRNLLESTRSEAWRMLWKIERYLRRTRMPATKFGRLAAGDPRLVFDMRNGRTPRAPMERRLEHFMKTHQEGTDVR